MYAHSRVIKLVYSTVARIAQYAAAAAQHLPKSEGKGGSQVPIGQAAWNLGNRLERTKATVSPTLLDIAWAAGIFEGEGHASMKRGSASLHVSQKHTWILHKLRDMFGGSVNVYEHIGTLGYWQAYGANARGFLMTIYGFLSPHKQAQVGDVLREVKHAEKSFPYGEQRPIDRRKFRSS